MTQERILFISLRVGLGLIFLWAFFDKVFGLGFSTAPEAAWIAGGSPTMGYLLHATYGPLAGVFQALGHYAAWVDWVFMAGLLGVGIGLTSGVALRFSAYAGIAMLLLMYLSAFPPAHHPFIDEHIVYILALLLLAKRG